MTILAALNRHYERLAAAGLAPPYGYSTEQIGHCLVLTADGGIKRPLDLRNSDGRKPAPVPLAVPASFKRPGTTPRAFFLWDNSKFALGVGRDKETKDVATYPAHFAAFRDRHLKALTGTDDSGLLALRAFVQAWTPERFAELPEDMLDQNIVFMLDADVHQHRFLHDRPAARSLWQREADSGADRTSMCLVTGNAAPAARLHPAIKGVWGAQSSGASLVSFNLDAFTSYGKEQGDNAPVSEAAAFGYGTALNALLSKSSRTRLQVGDASTVFWADTSGIADARAAIAAAEQAEGLVAAMLNPPRFEDEDETPRDDQEEAKLRDLLKHLEDGRPLEKIAPGLDPHTRFFVLGLAPNSARLSVRFWHETDLSVLLQSVRQHWLDLRLEPPPWKGNPKLQALLYAVAVQGKAENIPPLLGGELMRAILEPKRPYPQALLSAAIQRIRVGDQSDKPSVFATRAAICKAWLVRDLRLTQPAKYKEDAYVSLDRDSLDPAYRLGRLFALLESVQYQALGSVNASIRDRYFGAASATPAGVFPLLLRGSNHHLSVLRKDSRKKRLAGWFEGQIAEIMGGLDMQLPRHLGLEAQGRFVVGYYHQRATRNAKADGEDAAPGNADAEATDLEPAAEGA